MNIDVTIDGFIVQSPYHKRIKIKYKTYTCMFHTRSLFILQKNYERIEYITNPPRIDTLIHISLIDALCIILDQQKNSK